LAQRVKTVETAESVDGVEYRLLPKLPAYRVGTDGSIWSRLKSGGSGTDRLAEEWHQLRPRSEAGGPPVVELRNSGRGKKLAVRRLVLLAFAGLPEGRRIQHLDGNRQNNRLENLRYVPRGAVATARRGEFHPQAKLTADLVRAIRILGAAGWGPTRIAKCLGLRRPSVNKVLLGEVWAWLDANGTNGET
jgi:hypothetical protein